MFKCDSCICNNVCDHDRYGFENCNHYKDNSLIIKLPCKIGDTIYYTPLNTQGCIIKATVVAIYISDEKMIRKKLHKSHVIAVVQASNLNTKINFEDFRKYVFNNYDDAIRALEEREV